MTLSVILSIFQSLLLIKQFKKEEADTFSETWKDNPSKLTSILNVLNTQNSFNIRGFLMGCLIFSVSNYLFFRHINIVGDVNSNSILSIIFGSIFIYAAVSTVLYDFKYMEIPYKSHILFLISALYYFIANGDFGLSAFIGVFTWFIFMLGTDIAYKVTTYFRNNREIQLKDIPPSVGGGDLLLALSLSPILFVFSNGFTLVGVLFSYIIGTVILVLLPIGKYIKTYLFTDIGDDNIDQILNIEVIRSNEQENEKISEHYATNNNLIESNDSNEVEESSYSKGLVMPFGPSMVVSVITVMLFWEHIFSFLRSLSPIIFH